MSLLCLIRHVILLGKKKHLTLLHTFLLLDAWAPRVMLIELHREQSRGMRSVESQEIQPRSCDGPATSDRAAAKGKLR